MSVHALKLSQHYIQEEPLSAARQLENMTPELGAALLENFPSGAVEGVLKLMEPTHAANLLSNMSFERALTLLASLPVSDVAAIMRFGNSEQLAPLIAKLPASRQKLCRTLLRYPDNTLGTLVETELLIVDEKMTAGEVQTRLKKRLHLDSQLLYVVDKGKNLLGTLSVVSLLRQSTGNLVSTMQLQPIPLVSGLVDLSSALAMPCWSSVDTIAICNRHNQFVGIVRHVSLRKQGIKQQAENTKQVSLLGELVTSYSETVQAFLSLASNEYQRMEERP